MRDRNEKPVSNAAAKTATEKTATEKTATVYRHIFAIAFEIESPSREASDLNPMQIRSALQKRLAEMQPWEFLENWEGYSASGEAE